MSLNREIKSVFLFIISRRGQGERGRWGDGDDGCQVWQTRETRKTRWKTTY
ncbi:MAG: hypothetical protein ACHBN1_18225 [Heteroscytonema crispum UTEX LB 1556]